MLYPISGQIGSASSFSILLDRNLQQVDSSKLSVNQSSVGVLHIQILLVTLASEESELCFLNLQTAHSSSEKNSCLPAAPFPSKIAATTLTHAQAMIGANHTFALSCHFSFLPRSPPSFHLDRIRQLLSTVLHRTHYRHCIGSALSWHTVLSSNSIGISAPPASRSSLHLIPQRRRWRELSIFQCKQKSQSTRSAFYRMM